MSTIEFTQGRTLQAELDATVGGCLGTTPYLLGSRSNLTLHEPAATAYAGIRQLNPRAPMPGSWLETTKVSEEALGTLTVPPGSETLYKSGPRPYSRRYAIVFGTDHPALPGTYTLNVPQWAGRDTLPYRISQGDTTHMRRGDPRLGQTSEAMDPVPPWKVLDVRKGHAISAQGYGYPGWAVALTKTVVHA